MYNTIVKSFGKNRHIICTEVQDRCFIYQSFSLAEGSCCPQPTVSFLYDNGEGIAVEWETYGPIQTFTKCEENYKEETKYGNIVVSRPHWHFSFVKDDQIWSSGAVDDELLVKFLMGGNIEYIFRVLERWSEYVSN